MSLNPAVSVQVALRVLGMPGCVGSGAVSRGQLGDSGVCTALLPCPSQTTCFKMPLVPELLPCVGGAFRDSLLASACAAHPCPEPAPQHCWTWKMFVV